jgi:hypothetical protein
LYRTYLAKGIPASRLCDTHVDHIAWSRPGHKHRQAIEIAHTVSTMRQALDGHSTAGQLWLDLIRDFVYLSAVPAHGLPV